MFGRDMSLSALLQASKYLSKLPPKFAADDRILVCDPMLATGESPRCKIVTNAMTHSCLGRFHSCCFFSAQHDAGELVVPASVQAGPARGSRSTAVVRQQRTR